MKKYYGDPFVGGWYCANCDSTVFPMRILEMEEKGEMKWKNGWHCAKCGKKLVYDEFA
jgi:methionyl-tRNA synthetase